MAVYQNACNMYKPGQLITIRTVFGGKVYRVVTKEFIKKLSGLKIENDHFEHIRQRQKDSYSLSTIYKNIPENCILSLLQCELYKNSKKPKRV